MEVNSSEVISSDPSGITKVNFSEMVAATLMVFILKGTRRNEPHQDGANGFFAHYLKVELQSNWLLWLLRSAYECFPTNNCKYQVLGKIQ